MALGGESAVDWGVLVSHHASRGCGGRIRHVPEVAFPSDVGREVAVLESYVVSRAGDDDVVRQAVAVRVGRRVGIGVVVVGGVVDPVAVAVRQQAAARGLCRV